MGEISSNWQLSSVIALSLIGSIFFKAGSGACFAAVPLIQKNITGEMAGLAGAYGCVGAVCFLTLYSFVPPQVFFKIIAAYAFLVLLALFSLKPFRVTSPN
jgi:NNP family nitrate/nitrite transporter-like MFS transporter